LKKSLARLKAKEFKNWKILLTSTVMVSEHFGHDGTREINHLGETTEL
jgi:hypothetical protein